MAFNRFFYGPQKYTRSKTKFIYYSYVSTVINLHGKSIQTQLSSYSVTYSNITLYNPFFLVDLPTIFAVSGILTSFSLLYNW